MTKFGLYIFLNPGKPGYFFLSLLSPLAWKEALPPSHTSLLHTSITRCQFNQHLTRDFFCTKVFYAAFLFFTVWLCNFLVQDYCRKSYS